MKDLSVFLYLKFIYNALYVDLNQSKWALMLPSKHSYRKSDVIAQMKWLKISDYILIILINLTLGFGGASGFIFCLKQAN